MPLIHIDHSKVFQLEAEFRALWRKLDRLGTLTETPGDTSPPPEPEDPGGGFEPTPGTMLIWTKVVDIVIANADPLSVHTDDFVVADIPGPYTHLEVDTAVITGPAIDGQYDMEWNLRGTNSFFGWVSDGEEPPGWQNYDHPEFQSWSTGGPGRYRAAPSLSVPLQTDDVSFFPINPVSGLDKLNLKWTITAGGNPPNLICPKAFIVGRYILHDTALFGPHCPVG